MEQDDDDDDEEEEENDDEDEEEEVVCLAFSFPISFRLLISCTKQEDYAEIDPSAIQSSRTRGKKVDYTSAEALAKAGLEPEAEDEDDE
jgi:hypothetical protein